MIENINVSDILYADFDIENENIMFVVAPKTNKRFEFENYTEKHEPVIIYDEMEHKSYLVKFDI